MAESDIFNVTLPAFTIWMGKFSSMGNMVLDVEGNLGSKLAYNFPLSKAC